MYGKAAPSLEEQKQICDLYQSGLRLKDVARETGFCMSTVKKFMAINNCPSRRRGANKGNGKVRNFDDSGLVGFKLAWDRLPSAMKGTIAEAYVKNRLAELGFDVWEPFGQNHVTDLIVVNDNKICRIQVKSATYDIKTKAFRANVTRHRRGSSGVTPYLLEQVDYFVIYCGGLEITQFYVVPSKHVIGRYDLKLYPHRVKGPLEGRSVDWAEYRNAFYLLGQP